MKKYWGLVLMLGLCLFAAGIADGADIKLKNDFTVNNPHAILDEGWKNLPDEIQKAYGPKSKFVNTRYISTYKGEFADCIIFIVPDKDVPDGYDFVVFQYPSLELAEIGGALIGDWDSFYQGIDEITDPDFAP